MRAGDLMRREPIAVSAAESLGHGARVLARHRLGAVPVVRRDALVGLLTDDDLLDLLATLLDGDPPPSRPRAD